MTLKEERLKEKIDELIAKEDKSPKEIGMLEILSYIENLASPNIFTKYHMGKIEKWASKEVLFTGVAEHNEYLRYHSVFSWLVAIYEPIRQEFNRTYEIVQLKLKALGYYAAAAGEIYEEPPGGDFLIYETIADLQSYNDALNHLADHYDIEELKAVQIDPMPLYYKVHELNVAREEAAESKKADLDFIDINKVKPRIPLADLNQDGGIVPVFYGRYTYGYFGE